MSKKRKVVIAVIFVLVIMLSGVIFFGYSYAANLESGARVAENSDLTYYLDIIYDGKDSDVITSSDSATANVMSDYIYVEDKIPDGLIFKEFVESPDGTIGAVKRSDGTSCPGYVVGDQAGLTYDESTRTVSFKVKNLQAGCKLTVGIITTTPSLGNKSRMDFYNTAFARENNFSINSNTVHVFMGKEEETLYNVTYQYTGDVPENAPTVPGIGSYASGVSVGVNANPVVAGYDFSGWTTKDVTVSNNSFIMPTKNVTFTGSFSKKQVYKVTYSVTGDIPDGYMPPKDKEYGPGDDVVIDSLKEDDVINGYVFSGWTNEDVNITDGIFVMPSENVQLDGSFERIKYKVTYQFQGVNIPPNADALLPAEVSYYPGDTVTLADEPVAEGYKFLGWYKNSTFEMPEEDVVIYGEWKVETGTFTPEITKEIVNPKDYYSKDDVIQFKITIRNTASFPIRDVIVRNLLEGSTFVENENYTLLSSQFVKIPSISAGGSAEVYASYTAGSDVVKVFTDIVSLDGAIADNNYSLDTSNDYKAENSFIVANISLQITKIDKDNNELTGAEFTLYQDKAKATLMATGTTFDKLQPNSTYYLEETKAPTGYVLLGKTLEVKIDGEGTISIDGYDLTNQNGVGSVRIVNDKINILPNTGGVGNVPFVFGGIIVVLASVIGYLYYIYKKKR